MEILTTFQNNGGIAIPNKIRKMLGIEPGDAIMLRVENDILQVIPIRQAVQIAQEKVRRHIPAETSLMDDFLAERKKETANE